MPGSAGWQLGIFLCPSLRSRDTHYRLGILCLCLLSEEMKASRSRLSICLRLRGLQKIPSSSTAPGLQRGKLELSEGKGLVRGHTERRWQDQVLEVFHQENQAEVVFVLILLDLKLPLSRVGTLDLPTIRRRDGWGWVPHSSVGFIMVDGKTFPST